ncbi:mRNA polyadenylation factor [Lithospermum erythrorhizon]|uniref:mRNA polyadenylation factor n=1 Tax=Lithospermum erythrorhizon TaxID=34254 RepID=A0AAV3QMT4_LITER
MAISLDYTKFELLQDNMNLPPKKHKEKVCASKRKKKGKNHSMKKQNSTQRSSEDLGLARPVKDIGYDPMCSKDGDVHSSSKVTNTVEEDHTAEVIQPAVEMGNGKGSNEEVFRGASRRSKKERNKARNGTIVGSPPVKSPPAENMRKSSSRDSFQANSTNSASRKMHNDDIPGNITTQNDKFEPSSSPSRLNGADIGSKFFQRHSDKTSDRQVDMNMDKVRKDKIDSEALNAPVVEFHDDIKRMNGSLLGGKHPNNEIESSSDGTRTNAGRRKSTETYNLRAINAPTYVSYEWPSLAPFHLPSANSHRPAATDRLHLEVGHNWQTHLHQSLIQPIHQVRNSSRENGHCGVISQPLPMSFDWPPIIHGVGALPASVTCNYDSEFISRRQSSFQQCFPAQTLQTSTVTSEDERVYSSDFMDCPEHGNSQDLTDEHDYWMSEDELEVQAVAGMDYNQYFGGGVMYWTPSDYPGPNFSRAPSLSSDDSSWAWREADMSRDVDDMVAFSSSYSTNGLTSPSAASFCSPFDPLASGHQALGYVIPETEMSGKVLQTSSSVTDVCTEEKASGSSLPVDNETKAADSLPYPILRPIIIPSMSRDRSRSEFKRNQDHRSPCVPPNRREQPLIKRPPSPVVLCVPRAPRPPPPSPVADSRKLRGFPTVRSGSSSPRHWGVRGWLHDGNYFGEPNIRMDGSEVIWPSWRNKSLSARQLTQPVPGALLQDRLIAISQLTRDQEHPDVAFPLQPPEIPSSSSHKESLPLLHNLLHDEIDWFCKQVAAENMTRKPYINWAVKRVTRSLQVLWPRSRTNIFGSNATGLSLPSSDVDLVVCLPPVRNLEPIKEAGILEGRNGIKETCLQHAARYLANLEWVKNDSLKIVENTAIPIIMLVVEVPHDFIASTAPDSHALKEEVVPETTEEIAPSQADATVLEGSASSKCPAKKNENRENVKSIRIDISFKSPSHTGLQTTELVKELTEQFPAAIPLALVLKQFLADRSLDQSYSGGLSSYCLVLLITRFLQHEHHHGRSIVQNYGSLLMDFFYFFGNVFDPRQMRISVQGSGVYIKRESGHSIDPIYIDDPFFPTNNVGRNCFRIHQCIKAFADAYSTLERELECLSNNDETSGRPPCKLLTGIIPSIGLLDES